MRHQVQCYPSYIDGMVLDSAPAMQATWCIESDSQSVIYTIFVLGIVKIYPYGSNLANWPGSWFP